MFEQRDGMLRNILTREVPTLAAEYAERVLDDRARARPAATAATSPPGSCMPAAATCCSRSSSRFELDDDAVPLQRGDAARVRQPVRARSSTSCSRPRSPTARARRLVVAVVVRRRLQLPRRAAEGRLTGIGAMLRASSSRRRSTTSRPTTRRRSARAATCAASMRSWARAGILARALGTRCAATDQTAGVGGGCASSSSAAATAG